MNYWINGTYAKFVPGYSPFLLFLQAFCLAAVSDMKVAKTDTSFLVPFFLGYLLT